jgi:RNA polymerase sigma factor (sigma-70 family)
MMDSDQPTVFVVDDDPDMRASLTELLSASELPVRTFESAAAFLEKFDDSTPGCALLDIRMPGMDGLELQEKIRERGSEIPIIIMTAYGDVPTAVRALRNGATDFVEKPFQARALVQRIRQAIERDVEARKSRAERSEVSTRFETLTKRERDVLRLLVDGRSLKDTASELDRSVKTVEAHITRIKKKLEVDSRAELIRFALRAGFVEP